MEQLQNTRLSVRFKGNVSHQTFGARFIVYENATKKAFLSKQWEWQRDNVKILVHWIILLPWLPLPFHVCLHFKHPHIE